MTKETSSTSVPTSTPVMKVKHFVPSLEEGEEHANLQLDGPWVVRRYTYFASDNEHYLLYHYHPAGVPLKFVRSDFERPALNQATLGLVASPPGISDKAVGHARCVVCDVVAPGDALGFLEMCKWER